MTRTEINLSEQASGVLPGANGGTGIANTFSGNLMSGIALNLDPAYSGLCMLPTMFNDIAYNDARGGSITTTLNGAAVTMVTPEAMFAPDSTFGYLNTTTMAATDTLVITVNCCVQFAWNMFIGIMQDTGFRCSSVKIEYYQAGTVNAWATLFNQTGLTDGLVFASTPSFGGTSHVTQLRYTLTNTANGYGPRIINLFALAFNSPLLAGSFMPYGGGTMYGPINMNGNAITGLPAASVPNTALANIPPSWVNVVSHGADPTGAADSTTAFKNAVAALPAAGGTASLPTGGGVIYVPAGNYKISSTIALTQFQGIIGDGQHLSILQYSGTGPCINASNTNIPTGDPTPCRFAGFTIDGTNAGSGSLGIQIGNLFHSSGTDMQIQNFLAAAISAPTGLAATGSATGGTLAAGTYRWVITALNACGETTVSNEVSATLTGTTSSVSLTWTATANATGYNVYRSPVSGGTGSENTLVTTITSGTTVAYTDVGGTGTADTPPGYNGTAATGILFKNYGTVPVADRQRWNIGTLECANHVVFDGNCAPGQGSFSYADYAFSIVANQNQNILTLRNNAVVRSSRMAIQGVVASTTATNTAWVIGMDVGSPADQSTLQDCQFLISVESDAGAGLKTAQSIRMESTNAGELSGVGVLNFIAGYTSGVAYPFQAASIATGSVFGFSGRISEPSMGLIQWQDALNIQGGTQRNLFDNGLLAIPSSFTIEPQLGDVQQFVLPNTSCTIAGFLDAPYVTSRSLEILLQQPASGAPCTVAWPANVTWLGGACILSTANSAIDRVRLTYYPSNNTWYGELIAPKLAAGTGLALTGNTLSVDYGTTAGTACQGNDTRVVNALQNEGSATGMWFGATSALPTTGTSGVLYVCTS